MSTEIPIREAIIQILHVNGVSINALSHGDKALQRRLHRQIKEGAAITEDTIRLILKEFPRVNKDWLLTGEGEMLKPTEANAEFLGNARRAIAEEMVEVRFFEVTPTASFKEFCDGADQTADTIALYPEKGDILDDSACVFEIAGESMAPQIQPGSKVLCREIPPTKWHTLRDCVVVIAYADRFVIKRLARNDLEFDNTITLASDNPDYPDRERVPLCDIRCIFRATRVISQPIS